MSIPLPNFAESEPDSLKDFVDERVNQGSKYVREVIRKDQDRLQLRTLLLVGAKSAQTKPVDDAYTSVKPKPVVPRERATRDVHAPEAAPGFIAALK
jgi:antitoxin ParD1/3/4